MDRETMRKLVCRFAYKVEYNPDTFRKIDWDEMLYRFEHEPGEKSIELSNESKVNFIRQEYIMLEELLNVLKEMMLQLETKHEKWMVYKNEIFRYRDSRSLEGKPMMEGPKGVAIEDWYGYFYNSLLEYKEFMEKELGIAAKGDIGEENVAKALENSTYAEYTVHNVVLNVSDEGGKTNEIDTFVILPCGVAVLEIKNYGKEGQTLIITDNDKWDLYDAKNTNKQVKNPAYQNSRHTRATIITLKKLFGRDIPVFPLVVIGNNQVILEKYSNMAVRNLDDFIPYLASLKSDEFFSDEERIKIKKFLEKEDIGQNFFSMISYREQMNHIKMIANEIFVVACFNQDGKRLYYKLQGLISYGIIGFTVLVLIIGALIFRNFDSFTVLLLAICFIIATVAVVVQIGKEFVKKIKSIVGDR